MAHMTNPLVTPEQLYQRGSFSALPSDLLDAVFFAAQCLTQAAGVLLQLPQSATAQANVLLARFWIVEPIMAHEFSDASAASIYLVAKTGASPRSPRDVTKVYAYLLSSSSPLFRSSSDRDKKTPSPPDPSAFYLSESAYQAAHTRLLAVEARILYALGFDCHVALPHPLAVTYLQALDFLGIVPGPERDTLAHRTVAHLNTALLSPQLLYLTHQPNALAVAAVYNAARDGGARMPDCEWWEVFDVDREELGFLVVGMRSVNGWARKMPLVGEGGGGGGMVTRRMVEDEMRKRGLNVGNGHAAEVVVLDEEEELTRKMDEASDRLPQDL